MKSEDRAIVKIFRLKSSRNKVNNEDLVQTLHELSSMESRVKVLDILIKDKDKRIKKIKKKAFNYQTNKQKVFFLVFKFVNKLKRILKKKREKDKVAKKKRYAVGNFDTIQEVNDENLEISRSNIGNISQFNEGIFSFLNSKIKIQKKFKIF